MKQFIKQIFFITLEFFLVNKLFRYLNRGKIKVLLYHNIVSSEQKTLFSNAITENIFRKQITYLQKNYNFISLSQQGKWHHISKVKVNVLLTFDDGFINNYEIVLPILQEFGIQASFFLITKCLEESNVPSFIQNPESHQEFRTININQAKYMLKQGMNIGSHSLYHNDNSKLSVKDSVQNAEQSKQSLEKMLETPVECFAFPWGFYREEQIEPIKKTFSRIFTVKHGFNFKEDQILNRNEVDGLYHLYATASGALDYFKKQ
ncbi:polysaccharide deacetylase family protein [Candidatus Marithrix sp. Canyon 246]|uniref:polysaccharide deacetylase family protein n=1 Tax=Candidatus Marithrix sp. Canyon 246 TaxID=1827136 RepID=UPI00084A1C05|nr:polysaccharide deacetylase family protein [Candidatus Marithrix sp. Canyon 246]